MVVALGYVCATAALPIAVAQQQAKPWRVGILNPRSRDSLQEPYYKAFLSEMKVRGYVEGKNGQYEWRFADDDYERLPRLATDLVNLNVDVIVAINTPAVRAAQRTTKTIPIVMTSVADPVATGLVTSLARPEGNTTGVANLVGETSKKQLDLLLALVPNVKRVAVLLNPKNQSSDTVYKTIESAARHSGISTFPIQAETTTDLEQAFASAASGRAQAFLLVGDSFFTEHRADVLRLATKNKLPAVFPFREFVEAGGLMSYGPNLVSLYRQAALLVDKILRGAKPRDLPIFQAEKFDLVLNLRTAKALGINVSRDFRTRVDEVIE